MRKSRHSQGFTAAEMLVACAIGAMVIGAASMVYYSLVLGQRRLMDSATVTITNAANLNFYNVDSPTISTVVAPNYGSVARAEALRERFLEDTAQSVAVFCLYRPTGTYNTIRPATIDKPPATTKLDTPESFRAYLNTVVSGASAIFTVNSRTYASLPSYSIFVLGYSPNFLTIPVLAVYDVDLIPAYDPSNAAVIGTYASVRRYVNSTGAVVLSSYYDVLYRTVGATDSFYPPVVAFERASRLTVAEAGIDPFKQAAEQPFYFVWWPDPARSSLALPQPNTSNALSFSSASLNAGFSSTDPRKIYNHMAGRTSYMFTVPMFPSG